MNPTLVSNLFDQLSHGYRIDHRFGPVYDHAPAGADDLNAIRGIDTRKAVTLNRLGVYFLRQVALWEHSEICAFAEELGMTPSTLTAEQWVEQARNLCRPRSSGPSNNIRHLPASLVRTVTLLGCALLVGCLFVYWLGLQSNQPIRGMLAADITSLRVPAESRLLKSHVRPGDEVFSGDSLLILEKTEHLATISVHEQRIRELKQRLQQADAQAALDLEWRTRELDHELSEVRTRAHLIQEVKRTPVEHFRAASLTNEGRIPTGNGVYAVSNARTLRGGNGSPNTMIFISGKSGKSSIDVPRPPRLPGPVQSRTARASEVNGDSIQSIEARSIELRLQKLEELRALLPQQVRRAAGVESIRVQFDEASQRLAELMTLSREVDVICPAYGKVGQVRYKAGDTMSTGEIMLKILHADRRYVLLNVPTSRLNEIEPGTSVVLIFPGNERYRGKVSNLPMLAEAAALDGQSVATVRVEPSDKLWPEIPIGSRIDVFLNDDRVF
jgi:multidrug efflux pump subunit AcrA (membrane-fusion protein)